jgi:hypothetical protein
MGLKDIGTVQTGSADFVKLASGDETRLHVLSEDSFTFGSVFREGEKKGINIKPGTIVPGEKVNEQHAFYVYDFSSKSIKIWCVGIGLAKVLAKMRTDWKESFERFDILLSRQGEKLNTKWMTTSVPTEFNASLIEGLERPDMDELIPMADAKALADLGATTAQGQVNKKVGR